MQFQRRWPFGRPSGKPFGRLRTARMVAAQHFLDPGLRRGDGREARGRGRQVPSFRRRPEPRGGLGLRLRVGSHAVPWRHSNKMLHLFVNLGNPGSGKERELVNWLGFRQGHAPAGSCQVPSFRRRPEPRGGLGLRFECIRRGTKGMRYSSRNSDKLPAYTSSPARKTAPCTLVQLRT